MLNLMPAAQTRRDTSQYTDFGPESKGLVWFRLMYTLVLLVSHQPYLHGCVQKIIVPNSTKTTSSSNVSNSGHIHLGKLPNLECFTLCILGELSPSALSSETRREALVYVCCMAGVKVWKSSVITIP